MGERVCRWVPVFNHSHAYKPHTHTHTQQGKVVIGKVSSVLVALMSDESVGFGMLKAKVQNMCCVVGPFDVHVSFS